MRILSLIEFKNRFQNGFYGKTFVFSTDNQTWHNTESTLDLELVFSEATTVVAISPHTNTIFLKDKQGNSLRLNRVKEIREEEPCSLGKVFTVACGERSSPKNDMEYTLIVR